MLIEKISELISVCDEKEKALVEKMVLSAGDYVQVVVHMETKAWNIIGYMGEDLRNRVSLADKERTSCHNALITYVDIVNRLCAQHSLAPIYTGDTLRRHYGDFAVQLVIEIFGQRK